MYNKLPNDFNLKVENETQRRIEEFAKLNKDIYDKLSYIEKTRFELWVSNTVTYELYRLYGVTEEEFYKKKKDEQLIKFVDLK